MSQVTQTKASVVEALNTTTKNGGWLTTAELTNKVGSPVANVMHSLVNMKNAPVKRKKIKGHVHWAATGKEYTPKPRKGQRKTFSSVSEQALDSIAAVLEENKNYRDELSGIKAELKALVNKIEDMGL